jgi:RimJ/RimL family protein N-acetyltransferase
MLIGEKVGLRARLESDVAILHDELHGDVATKARTSAGPWLPISPSLTASPYKVTEPTDDAARFSIVELSDGQLAGASILWGIDTHNRLAHIGISLRPSFRGRGLGADAVRVLCDYGFRIRGLHRLQIETLADNMAMIKAATSNAFTMEGTFRKSAWVDGAFVDEVVLGRLAD